MDEGAPKRPRTAAGAYDSPPSLAQLATSHPDVAELRRAASAQRPCRLLLAVSQLASAARVEMTTAVLASRGKDAAVLARMLLNFSPYSWQPGGIMQLQLYLPATL